MNLLNRKVISTPNIITELIQTLSNNSQRYNQIRDELNILFTHYSQ